MAPRVPAGAAEDHEVTVRSPDRRAETVDASRRAGRTCGSRGSTPPRTASRARGARPRSARPRHPPGPSSSSAYAVWRSPFWGSSPARRVGSVQVEMPSVQLELGACDGCTASAVDECLTAPPRPSTPAATSSPRPSRPRRDETLEAPPCPTSLVGEVRLSPIAAEDGGRPRESRPVRDQPTPRPRRRRRLESPGEHDSPRRDPGRSSVGDPRGDRELGEVLRAAGLTGEGSARRSASAASCSRGSATSPSTSGGSPASSRSARSCGCSCSSCAVPVAEAERALAPLPLAPAGAARPRRVGRRGGHAARPHRPARRDPDRLGSPAARRRGGAGLRRRGARAVAHALAPHRAPPGRDRARRRHRLRGPGDPRRAPQRARAGDRRQRARARRSPRSTPR